MNKTYINVLLAYWPYGKQGLYQESKAPCSTAFVPGKAGVFYGLKQPFPASENNAEMKGVIPATWKTA